MKATDVIDMLSDVPPARRAAPHSFGQWARVRRQGGSGLDRRCRCRDRPHRARQPVGERLAESSNARLRDELLNGEIFYRLKEAQIVIESWRRHYNAVRPHASLGYRPSAPAALVAWPSARPHTAPTATLPLAPKPPLN